MKTRIERVGDGLVLIVPAEGGLVAGGAGPPEPRVQEAHRQPTPPSTRWPWSSPFSVSTVLWSFPSGAQVTRVDAVSRFWLSFG